MRRLSSCVDLTDGSLRYPAEAGGAVVHDRCLFEIDGPGKAARQLEGHGAAYLALDDIEHGRGRLLVCVPGNVMPIECS